MEQEDPAEANKGEGGALGSSLRLSRSSKEDVTLAWLIVLLTPSKEQGTPSYVFYKVLTGRREP